MYTEGIKIGDNTYLLSDEDGTLTLLNGTVTQEEMEEYIKLKNDYDEKLDESHELLSRLSQLRNYDKQSKRDNIEILLSTMAIEGFFILLGAGTTNVELLIIIPSIIIGAGALGKVLKYGTKKGRTKRKKILNSELEKVYGELKEIEKKKQKLQKKIKNESYFLEDEIIPVTTVENKKAHVKMRVLKLEQNGQ